MQNLPGLAGQKPVTHKLANDRNRINTYYGGTEPRLSVRLAGVRTGSGSDRVVFPPLKTGSLLAVLTEQQKIGA